MAKHFRVSILQPKHPSRFDAGRQIPKTVAFGIQEIGGVARSELLEGVSISYETLDKCVELQRIGSTVIRMPDDFDPNGDGWREYVINLALKNL